MAKLEGIIYKTFNHYVVLRGFAPIKDLAAISHKPESYQRHADEVHKEDIVSFLSTGEYKYFPEITLACRVKDYLDFASNIGIDNAVDRDDAKFVEGLRVLSERLPYDGYRARHAFLVKKSNEDLVRVDGNHRLEPFDNDNDEIWAKTGADKKELEALVVPYTVIFSEQEFGDKFEAGIFHNINFRQLPLRLEASLRIIIDVNAFDDKESLGEEYPLAISLIKKIENTDIRSIPWLRNHKNIDLDYYRTSCLKIAQLLLNRKEVVAGKLATTEEKLSQAIDERDKKDESIKTTNEEIETLKTKIKQMEINYADFRLRSEYRESKQKLKDCENNKIKLSREKEYLDSAIHYRRSVIKKCKNYIESVSDVNVIETTIHTLQSIYNNFAENQRGNIAFLCALVYYAILDEAQLNAFIKWAKVNGINQIIESDDISQDSTMNLINMFEQIYQTKRNEVFVSMQFGDSQSELIYEKIVRAIELFNKKNSGIFLNIHPIRIDRMVEKSTYSIQDKILEAIQNCSLIIADLSSHNINVYHEIGYAMGIAQTNNMLPNLILLYKEDTDHNNDKEDVDKFVGFNLRNLSQLRFKNYDQLVDGLLRRLEKHYEV